MSNVIKPVQTTVSAWVASSNGSRRENTDDCNESVEANHWHGLVW